ncbi:hypothetical protein OFC57_41130, partial [Escherichia coli]|nr:hypothetical protein [Escherichia coli]
MLQYLPFKFLQTLDEHNAALRCERRLAILERSETAKRCESLLNALLCLLLFIQRTLSPLFE